MALQPFGLSISVKKLLAATPGIFLESLEVTCSGMFWSFASISFDKVLAVFD